MKKLILTATGLVCLAGAFYFMGSVAGQNQAADNVPHKIGLIDMGEVFNEYHKLKILREDYAAEQAAAEEEAKKHVEAIQRVQKQLATFTEGSPDYAKREEQLAKLTSDFETFRKMTQKDLLRKEAKMYHTVYQEVHDALKRLCEYHGYTLVLRFNREELNSADPQKLIQGLNRQVVYNRPRDDMTTPIIDMLNRQFDKATGSDAAQARPSKNAVKPASATRPDAE